MPETAKVLFEWIDQSGEFTYNDFFRDLDDLIHNYLFDAKRIFSLQEAVREVRIEKRR